MKILKRILCTVGLHWSGITDIGMYGDAARCGICGADKYDLTIIHGRNIDGRVTFVWGRRVYAWWRDS